MLIASPANDCKLRISIATPRRGIQEGRTLKVAAVERDTSREGDWATVFINIVSSKESEEVEEFFCSLDKFREVEV